MKKLAIGGIVVLLLGGYALWASTRSPAPAPSDSTSTTQTPATTGTTPTPTPASSGTAQEDPGIGDASSPGDNEPAGQYKDGTYTGAVGSAAPFGNVRVRATVSGGKLVAITMLENPQGPGYTDELASTTFPALVKEAIRIQSADVDIISGATQNTEGFQASLGSALAQAKR